MALVLDRRTELGDSPGTHALIVGISDYKHLPSLANRRRHKRRRINSRSG